MIWTVVYIVGLIAFWGVLARMAMSEFLEVAPTLNVRLEDYLFCMFCGVILASLWPFTIPIFFLAKAVNWDATSDRVKWLLDATIFRGLKK